MSSTVFTDNAGAVWDLSLDAPTIFRVRGETCSKECCKHPAGACDGIDLAGIDGVGFEKLSSDPCLLVDVLWSICSKQAVIKNVDQQRFAESIKGDALDGAVTAMLAGIADFFPSSKRVLVTSTAAANHRMREMGIQKALAKINDPELEKRAMKVLDKMLDEQVASALTRLSSATKSPASSESAPEV